MEPLRTMTNIDICRMSMLEGLSQAGGERLTLAPISKSHFVGLYPADLVQFSGVLVIARSVPWGWVGCVVELGLGLRIQHKILLLGPRRAELVSGRGHAGVGRTHVPSIEVWTLIDMFYVTEVLAIPCSGHRVVRGWWQV